MSQDANPVPHAAADTSGPDLEPDVERLHRAIAREPRDPDEGREPVPWWVRASAVAALFWGGWYLGRYGGSFDTSTHVALGRRDPAVAGEAAGKVASAAFNPVQAGGQIFTARCQACHQADGRGVAGAFPPLVGSEWVTGRPETVVHILLDGLQGPVQVAGQTFNGAMPAWRTLLSDREIAAVATYVRQWKPNAAPAVDSALVAARRTATASRTAPWTAAELRAAEGAVAGAAGAGARAAGGRE